MNKAYAQQFDTTSTPSYPYSGNTNPPISGSQSEALIKLTSSTSSVQKDKTIDIGIFVNSDGADVTSLTVKINYDPSLLEIQDQNNSLPGNQVAVSDTSLTQVTNSIDSLKGELLLELTSPTAKVINSEIANIRFMGKASGQANISVSLLNSQIVNDSNEDILAVTEGIDITIQDSTPNDVVKPVTPPVLPETGVFGPTVSILLISTLLLFSAFVALIRNIFFTDDSQND